jgi:hypothetical protein
MNSLNEKDRQAIIDSSEKSLPKPKVQLFTRQKFSVDDKS